MTRQRKNTKDAGVEKKKAVKPTGVKINRQDFLLMLEKVKPGVASKELIEQSDHFVFDDDKIWTYNDEVSISLSFTSAITGSIKAQEFYTLLTKIEAVNIYLQQENNKLHIRAKNFHAVINVAEITLVTDGINPPGSKSKKWKSLPENFVDAVSFCIFSASTNMMLADFACIWLTSKDDQGLAVSCDGFRGTRYKLDTVLDDQLLLPVSAAKYMRVYNPMRYCLDGNWLHFINSEKIVFSSRVIATDYNQMIWDFFDVKDNKPIILPENFKSVIERAETIVVEEFAQDRFLTVKIDEGQIECRGEGKLGWVKEQADIKYSGKSIKFQIHPTLLADILNHTSEMIVSERLKFKTDTFEHIVCLSSGE